MSAETEEIANLTARLAVVTKELEAEQASHAHTYEMAELARKGNAEMVARLTARIEALTQDVARADDALDDAIGSDA